MMLLTAHRERRLIEPISATEELTLDTAYRVQRIVTEARLAMGEQIVGWKLGYTSQAMRLQMGVAEPNFGPLTDAMLLPNDGTVDPTLVQPRVEPEIGIVLARALEGGATLNDVLAATADALACLSPRLRHHGLAIGLRAVPVVRRGVRSTGGTPHHLRARTSLGYRRRQRHWVVVDPHHRQALAPSIHPYHHRPATVEVDPDVLSFHRGLVLGAGRF
jgi:hypothetical protein